MVGRSETGAAAATEADVQLWREWGRLTRFLESARLAFARERGFLGSIEFARPDRVGLAPPVQGGDYTVALSTIISRR